MLGAQFELDGRETSAMISDAQAGASSARRRPSSLLYAEDVAELLGVSKPWVYAEVRAGRVPHVKLGRYVRFRRESIEQWLRDLETGTG